jgi:CRP-like cAMP-binding protein
VYEHLAKGRRELNALFHASDIQNLNKGEALIEAGRAADTAYRVQKGLAYRMRRLADHRSIIDIYLPGDVIGFEAALHHHAPDTVIMATPGTARVIPLDRLLAAMMTKPAVALSVAWTVREAELRIEDTAAAIRCLDAETRMVRALVEFHDRLRRRQLLRGSSYFLPLTQRELGDYLGMTAIHVNRVLRSLRQQGIVVVEKQVVIVRDRERLLWLADANAAERARTGPSWPE